MNYWIESMMAKLGSPRLPVHLSRHFEERFREHFPICVVATESALQREAVAHFCPDDPDGRTYVTARHVCRQKVAFVVAAEHGLLGFATLFLPTLRRERRFEGRRTLLAPVLLGAVAWGGG